MPSAAVKCHLSQLNQRRWCAMVFVILRASSVNISWWVLRRDNMCANQATVDTYPSGYTALCQTACHWPLFPSADAKFWVQESTKIQFEESNAVSSARLWITRVHAVYIVKLANKKIHFCFDFLLIHLVTAFSLFAAHFTATRIITINGIHMLLWCLSRVTEGRFLVALN